MQEPEKALAVLAKVSGRPAEELDRDMDLVADLGIDSPKALQLLVELEEALGVEIRDEEADRMRSVGDLLDHLTSVVSHTS